VRFVIRLVRFAAGTGGHPQNWQGWRTYSRMGGAAPGGERVRVHHRTNGDETVAIATMPNAPTGLPHEGPQVLANDPADRELLANVHPPRWANPVPAGRYNLVVLGAGTAGLVTAAGAAGLGAKVAIVERALMGGDCLNVGCVPSKCLIRSSRVVGEIDRARQLGVSVPPGTEADFGAVMQRLRQVRARISEHDSARRFRDELGVDVFLGDARFASADTVEVGGQQLRFKRAVIATGARAVAPRIPGLSDVGFFTNETVFTLTERPPRVAVIGAGPIGCELAQAFARLGSKVVLLHDSPHVLNREDADAAEIVQNVFVREGIELVLGVTIRAVERRGGDKLIAYTSAAGPGEVAVDAIIVGAGRAPNVDGLDLERVGVAYDAQRGVQVDDHLRTANPRIFAAGDVCMAQKFTHAADFAARIVIQNALFFGRKKLSALTMPWCTYTDPEIAHVGLSEQDAQQRGVAIATFTVPMSDVDRALADGEEEGFVKIHVKKGGDEILGATIVARHAGEMISEITLAMVAKVGLGRLASVIHPYPTQAEALRKAGDAYNRTRLTPLVKKTFAGFLRWTR
jgi:pyruvate/2-oxoglutarate dehydrogenase complex dihydrolipoamide dehydrogenase (E3) component